ncbi:hypothetical protein G9F72_001265 [Clostridium estertheticum]|uniref:hypothetical protein n=1 Tax=Clostridium estertheticum TaxID=238834 RepID=UPI0013E907AA|nr:hypothetical protein [Clostridium estertheticum]MBZ9684988.1 hypothetical protein [Clostridium estertheticum]
MKSISLKTKIVTGLITGGMLLSSVSLAFATTTKPESVNGKAPFKNEFKQPKDELEATLKLGVSSNIITQAESDKILAYENSKVKTKDSKKMNKGEKPDLFKELVSSGILTQAKADALKSSERIQRDAKRQQELGANLAKLVTDKTITQDQSDKIKAAIVKEEALKKADFEKTKAMTQEERKAYMDASKASHVNPLKALVDSKVITEAQADKIGFGGPGKFNGKAPFEKEFKQSKAELASTLKVAVTSNIITQAESDKILAYENSKIKTKGNKEVNKTEKPDLFKELVSSGILTQAKADALKSSEQIQRDAKREQALETSLAKLVADKTITQDQSDKIKAAMIKEEALMKADLEKTKAMTQEERIAYMEANKGSHINPLKALVDSGIITQAQAEKVGPGSHGGPGEGRHMSGFKGK